MIDKIKQVLKNCINQIVEEDLEGYMRVEKLHQKPKMRKNYKKSKRKRRLRK